MKRMVKNLWKFVIVFTLIISSYGCSPQVKKTLNYETKVHEVTYTYVDCGDLKLKNIGIQLEDPTQHPGSYKNQKIQSSNLTILHYKLQEAQTILDCYRNQIKMK